MSNELGTFLRRARKIRKARLRDVAAAIGKTPGYVCDLEKGRRGMKMSPILALQLAKYLTISPVALFEKAGISDPTITRTYERYLKVTNDKSQAQALALSMENLRGISAELRECAHHYSPLRNLCNSLEDVIENLETSLI